LRCRSTSPHLLHRSHPYSPQRHSFGAVCEGEADETVARPQHRERRLAQSWQGRQRAQATDPEAELGKYASGFSLSRPSVVVK
jgi:hypothetical protein